MITSPLAGFIFGGLLMFLLFLTLHRFAPHFVNKLFGKLQIFERCVDGAQPWLKRRPKDDGYHCACAFHRDESWQLRSLTPLPDFSQDPDLCPTRLGRCSLRWTGGGPTAAGGWRIIRTLGHRMVKLQPVNGFAAETTAAMIIQAASYYGIPLSTTHVITTSIMGVGAVKRFSGMRWTVVERIIWAWLFTLPASGLIGYLLERTLSAL